jgi:hypothetical protein
VFAPLLSEPVAAMRGRDILFCSDAYPARPSARVALRALHPVIVWAARRELVPAALKDFTAGGGDRRTRRLDVNELARVLFALRGMDRAHARAMQLML